VHKSENNPAPRIGRFGSNSVVDCWFCVYFDVFKLILFRSFTTFGFSFSQNSQGISEVN